MESTNRQSTFGNLGVQNPTMSFGEHSAPVPPPQSNTTLVAALWRRKGILVFFLLCGLAAGYWYHAQQPSTFSSAALVEVYRQQARTSTGSALEEVKDLAPSVVFIEAEVKSDAVLATAVEDGKLTSFSGISSDSAVATDQVRRGLSVRAPGGKGGESVDRSLVLISFEAGDPALCAAAVNYVVQSYEKYVNGRHLKAIDSVKGFFRQAKDSILPQLEELEAEYTKFRGSTPLEWTADGKAINPYREDALKIELAIDTLQSDSKKLGNKLKLIEETSKSHTSMVTILQEVQYLFDEVSSGSSLEDALIAGTDAELEIEQRLAPLLVQRDLLTSQYGANHPAVATIEKEIESTRKTMGEIVRTKAEKTDDKGDLEARREEAARGLLRSYVNGIRKKKKLIDDEIIDMETRLTDVRERAHKLTTFETENESYVRRIERLQGMLDSFDEQLEKASLPLLNPGLQVNVLRPAGVGAPTGPNMPKNLAMGALLGALLGGALGWLIDWSERTYRSPDEVATTLGLPILAHLPMMLIKRKKKGKGEIETAMDAIDPSVMAVHDPHSPGAESIRLIRTSLFSGSGDGPEYRVIQVTSALPGDGKSTVVANLAASLARANKRVIVVDADLRRPTQESIFGMRSERGLTDALNGDRSLDDCIVSTPIENLFVLPTGPRPSNPAEALMLPEFSQVLDDLRQDFDVVLVDTPPLLAVTDASNVAAHVDGVLFVMRIGRNVKPMSKRAITMLRSLHVNIIGVVVNAIGDSGYSATYANAWSTSYGGQPGSEYGYGYYRYGSDRYLNASKGQSVTVKGRGSNSESRRKLVPAGPLEVDTIDDDLDHHASGNGKVTE